MKKSFASNIYIGTSGFSYKHWIGVLYPEKTPLSSFLEIYSKSFNTVEINSSFYRLPKKEMVKRWFSITPPNFTFALKVSKLITHLKKFKDVDEDLKRFFLVVDELGEKLGPLLFQLPPFIKMDDINLENFLKQLSQDYKYTFEFRHPSWFCNKTYKLLSRYNIACAIISAPKLPCEIVNTASFAYIRLHGITNWYGYNYSCDDLLWWAEKIKEFKIEVYVYFNNDFKGYAVENARMLIKFLS